MNMTFEQIYNQMAWTRKLERYVLVSMPVRQRTLPLQLFSQT